MRLLIAPMALIALAAVLTACADAEDATASPSADPTSRLTPTPTMTPSPSPTPSPTPTPTPTPTTAAAPGTYLALGDSLAVGVGATRPDDTGYVALVARALSDPDAAPTVATLRNLAISGETSSSMLGGRQLDGAVEAIRQADPPVSLVTLDIGGNDLLALLRTSECANDPQGAACLGMLAGTLAEFEETYRSILERLADALDAHAPGARLAVMTYFNPFSGTSAAYEAAGELALLGTDARVDCDTTTREERGMNDVIVCVGMELGAVPVDVQPRFAGLGLQLTHIGDEDIHANDEGYAVIADEFLEVLRREP